MTRAEPTATLSTVRAARLMQRVEIEEFYATEAGMLDERRFREWLGLFDEDAYYRVPITQSVHSSELERQYFTGEDDIHWMDEGLTTLRRRVEQFETGIHWAEEPVSRTTHIFTNLRLTDAAHVEPHGAVQATVSFVVSRNRLRDVENCLFGRRVDLLVAAGDTWKILGRTVYIDQATFLSNNLTVFI